MNAWQHPLERCRVCGQDILLRPEITGDLRMVYIRHCPGCGPAGGDADRSPEAERPREGPSEAYGGILGYEATVGGDPWRGDVDDMDARWEAFAARAEGDEQAPVDEPSEGTFMFAMEERGRRRFRLPMKQRPRQPA